MADAILLADVGVTGIRLRLAQDGQMGPITTLLARNYPDADGAIEAYLAAGDGAPRPRVAGFACAGLVVDDRVCLTHGDWTLEADALGRRHGFERVHLVNNVAAIARAIPAFSSLDLVKVGGVRADDEAPALVIGPGTGLGIAAYLGHGAEDLVIAGEGGHATMPAVTEREARILAALRRECDHVSAEYLLSADGLQRLYQAIAQLDKTPVQPRTPAGIIDAATSGGCPVSEEALEMFCAMLGAIAGNLALTFGARGGVYLAGTIAPRIARFLAASEFRHHFEAKGSFETYVARIPTWIIVHPEPAFLGLSRLVAA